jgi:hypothetical protein
VTASPDSSPFVGSGGGTEDNPHDTTSTAADYSTWTWEQIEAKLLGEDAFNGRAGGPDPQTLWNAGQVFEYTQQALSMVAQSMHDQAHALAGGDHAPWQGDAAGAFMDSMTLMSKQVMSNATVLRGGAAGVLLGGGAGAQDLPGSLMTAGNALVNAQNTVLEIDHWYAMQAITRGAPQVNGNPAIDAQIGQMMTSDMLQYGLMPLVGYYQITVASIVPPTATGGAGGGGGGGNLPPPPGLPPPPPGL